MKYLARFLFVLLIVGFVLWPYYSVRRFTNAVNANDVATVEDMIDWSDFRSAMKKMMVDGLMMKFAGQAPPGMDRDEMRSRMEKMFETPAVETKFQEFMRSKSVIKMLKTSKHGTTIPMRFQNEQWDAPWIFTIQDTDSEGRLVFTFKGLAWKLTGLKISAEELERIVQAQAIQ